MENEYSYGVGDGRAVLATTYLHYRLPFGGYNLELYIDFSILLRSYLSMKILIDMDILNILIAE